MRTTQALYHTIFKQTISSHRPYLVKNLKVIKNLMRRACILGGGQIVLKIVTCVVWQDISNTLWAFATLRHNPGRELLDAASGPALQMFNKFKPQEIANLLWSFASLDYVPSNALLDAMAVQMIARIRSFRPQV